MMQYPKIWNVPLYNDDFSGREAQLKELFEILDSEKGRSIKITISGLPGVGKTQLVKRFAYLHKEKYGLVWWLNAEANLENDYLKLAEHLGIDILSRHFNDIWKDLSQYLRTFKEGWLLIFDNLDNPEEIINFLPDQHTGAPGHILITSRDDISWSQTYPLNPFLEDESNYYLIKITGQKNDIDAKRLANRLGNLPLALSYAAGYIRAHDKSYQEYLDLYNERNADLINRQDTLNLITYTDYYRQTVRATFLLLFDKIKNHLASVELLFFCSFLNAEAIPKFLLEEFLNTIHTDFDDAYKPLRNYMILQRDKLLFDKDNKSFTYQDSYSLHRLVQEFINEQIPINDKAFWINRCLTIVKKDFQPDMQNIALWQKAMMLISHVEELLNWADKYQMQNDDIRLLIFNAFNFCFHKDLLEMVKKNFNRLKNYMQQSNSYDPDFIKSYAVFLLNWVLFYKAARAEPHEYTEIINKIDEYFDSSHWLGLNQSFMIFDLKYQLANALLEKGEAEFKREGNMETVNRSEKILKSLLEELSHRPDQNREIECLCRIGTLYQVTKKHDLALKYFFQVHEIHTAAGNIFPNVSFAYNAIGTVYRNKDNANRDLEKSIYYYTMAKDEVDRLPLLSKTTRFKAWAHYGLSHVFCELNDKTQANAHYQKFVEYINVLYKEWPKSYLRDKQEIEEHMQTSFPSQQSQVNNQDIELNKPEIISVRRDNADYAINNYLEDVKIQLSNSNIDLKYHLSKVPYLFENILEIIVEKINEFQTNQGAPQNSSFGILDFVISHLHTIHFGLENNEQSPVNVSIISLLKSLTDKGSQILIDQTLVEKTLLNINHDREKQCVREQELLHVSDDFNLLLKEIYNRALTNGLKSKDIFISYAWPISNMHNEDWTMPFILRFATHLNNAGLRAHLDQIHSGCGNLMHGFMDQRIKNAHHVIVICNRTMQYKFEKDGFTSVCYEYLQYINRYRKERPKRFIIPICLNEATNKPGLVGMFAEESIYNDGYFTVLGKVLKYTYEFGDEFYKWWKMPSR